MDGRWTRRWDRLLLWGFLAAFALARAGHASERDPFWQVRAGEENLAGVPLARPDTWTWSGVTGDWYPNSPLWNVLLALTHRLGGLWGVFFFSAGALLLLLAVTALLAARLGARPLPGLLGLFAMFAGALPYLGARATLGVQTLLMVAVLVGLLLSDRAATAPLPALLALTVTSALALSVLGNWIHLSFLVVGPGLAVVWAAMWALTESLSVRRRVLLAAGGAVGWLLGPVLSPYGLVGGLDRARAVQDAGHDLLTEWSSPFAASQHGQYDAMVVAALATAGAAGWWWYRQWRRGADIRLVAGLALVGIPASLAGLVALRFLGIGPVTLAPVVAVVATQLADATRRWLGASPRGRIRAGLARYSEGTFWRLVLTAVLVLLSPAVFLLAGEHGAPAEQQILSRVPAGCRLFSSPDIGGAAVLLRPDVPVWMDGRADFFGRDMLLRARDFYAGGGPHLVPPGAGCVLLDRSRPLTEGLRNGLASSPAWHLDATDDGFELWLPEREG